MTLTLHWCKCCWVQTAKGSQISRSELYYKAILIWEYGMCSCWILEMMGKDLLHLYCSIDYLN